MTEELVCTAVSNAGDRFSEKETFEAVVPPEYRRAAISSSILIGLLIGINVRILLLFHTAIQSSAVATIHLIPKLCLEMRCLISLNSDYR